MGDDDLERPARRSPAHREAAYRYISDQKALNTSYLRHLGPAFGTKYLYFVTKAFRDDPTPVMDAVVQRWFRANVPTVPLSVSWSSPESYVAFNNCLRQWAADFDPDNSLTVDDVEYLIFADQTSEEGSLEWAEPSPVNLAHRSGAADGSAAKPPRPATQRVGEYAGDSRQSDLAAEHIRALREMTADGP